MLNKTSFLLLATVSEGGLLITTLSLGWMFSVDPLERLTLDSTSLILGILGVLPLYIPFSHIMAQADADAWLDRIKRLAMLFLGNALGQCRRIDLLYVACLAGGAEEFFFRGLLQTGLELNFGVFWAVLVSNLLFGALHWITPGYALLAGGAGLYLGAMLYVTGEANLLVPMLIHAGYDYLALLKFRELCRNSLSC